MKAIAKVIMFILALTMLMALPACTNHNGNSIGGNNATVLYYSAEDEAISPVTEEPEKDDPLVEEPRPNPLYITDDRIDIRYFLQGGGDDACPYVRVVLDEVRHFFGEQISYQEGFSPWDSDFYEFESGISIAARRSNGWVLSVAIDFRLSEHPFVFHLSGIDGSSNRDDVVELFGDSPSITSNARTFGAAINYTYYVGNSRAAVFYFDDYDNVIAARFYFPM